MQRVHVGEIADQPWCPRAVRNGITDFLRFFESFGKCYHPILPRLKRALEGLRPATIIDLCSGGGGPWPGLHRKLGASPPRIILTDLRPNLDAFALAEKASCGKMTYCNEPVDATNVPEHLSGPRSLFGSFHHLPPDAALGTLRDAVRRRQGILIFEMSRRSLPAILMMLTTPVPVFFLTPLIRPFSWTRLFWTYVIPLIPLAATVDGVASCLRTYSPAELREMIGRLGNAEGYAWEVGIQRAGPPSFGITYLIGCPREQPVRNSG